MPASILSLVRPCVKCGACVRNAKGKCKPCTAATSAAWKHTNKASVNAYAIKWASEHPESRKISQQNRRARKKQSGGIISADLSERLFKLQKGKCPCCGQSLGSAFHLDHIIPLALGGVNEDWNIQLLRAKCNHQKKAKHPVDFMQSRGFLL